MVPSLRDGCKHFASTTCPLAFFPKLLVIGLLAAKGTVVHWGLAAGALSATTLLHIACNLWNDYEDHLRGVDTNEGTGGSGAIRELLIPAAQIRNASISFFVACVAIGFFLVGTLDWETNGRTLLLIGIFGTIGAASYSGWPFHYKYLALGEVLVFFLCGPFIAVGALTMLAPGELSLWYAAMAAYPLGLQAVLRLHGGNIRRIPNDIQAGARTIANLIGFLRSRQLYLLMLASLYCLVPIVYFVLQTTPMIFLSWLSLPVAFYQVYLLKKMRGPLDPLATKLKKSSLYLDLSFGLLYTTSFLLVITGD